MDTVGVVLGGREWKVRGVRSFNRMKDCSCFGTWPGHHCGGWVGGGVTVKRLLLVTAVRDDSDAQTLDVVVSIRGGR